MVYWERPYKARLEPPGMGLRRLYDLPVFTTTGTLSLTSYYFNLDFLFLNLLKVPG
ncbi:hypothetical protein YEP4_09945 [Yersinia enterocolitica subsp. palearctica YE-P4]|nr:hypothetical protein YE149_10030 [Yersinia enterocolitica subsp. palearctica YE-149]EOR76759.1 hypothetical protein YE150_09985 [Yersinia enterocolitica subsp. palearctica YE-150]EOR77102.1 hypothetical protein YEP1_10050 [Yersinia enterocolitica subsp. palearctica YE-P1]EOR82003.1 hypothetical protein YEP4_09945 [Yersinia enterocolitica subsp. palearctica YE-P4]